MVPVRQDVCCPITTNTLSYFFYILGLRRLYDAVLYHRLRTYRAAHVHTMLIATKDTTDNDTSHRPALSMIDISHLALCN